MIGTRDLTAKIMSQGENKIIFSGNNNFHSSLNDRSFFC